MVNIQGFGRQPLILNDSTYPIQPYLIKNCKIWNIVAIDKNWFNASMNASQVMIENEFNTFEIDDKFLKAC
jgi:hypothetical protein